MGDFVRDWKGWSGTERATALIIAALFPIVASALLMMALEAVDRPHSVVSVKVEAVDG